MLKNMGQRKTMEVPGGWITTVCSDSWQRFQKVRMPMSVGFTHTKYGRRDPCLTVVRFVPAVMSLSTAVIEPGSAERKKAL